MESLAATGEAVTRGATVTLRPITKEILRTIIELRVAPEQENFVADNATSLAQAAYEPYAWPRAIYADEMPVGFIMLLDNPHQPRYFLWRLMVDRRYQGLGFGRRAVELLIDYVLTRPNARELLVTYVPEEGSPQPFYASLGFEETGQEQHGELVMRLDLGGRARSSEIPPRPLTHVVLMKFHDPTPEVLGKATSLLRGLAGKVPDLRGLEVGTDVLHSPRSYDLALITRFDSLAGMQRYQEHPEHLKVLDYLRSVLASAVAVDFNKD